MTTAQLPKVKQTKKKQKLRNAEYYSLQVTYDKLYAMSQEGKTFANLIELITSQENILLAYRNIKKNKGSKTHGTNKTNILDVAKQEPERLVKYVRDRLRFYKPHTVRRKLIPKGDGRFRPLGIPTIEDRLIQQCILQVLTPICEAKFHQDSYGFRPNRGTHHAVARAYYMMQKQNLHYVVDIDIKGFFDNVDQGKLLKQIWHLGIKDKKLISIISAMLKAEIEGEGIPTKGTPQGGILSPLLSNIVLNELDWWVASQWAEFETEKNYEKVRIRNGNEIRDRGDKYRAMRTTKLKEMHIVRYADDFKIFCRNLNTAKRIFIAVEKWLKERLGLEISPEKSKITNLKKNYTNFLGFKMKVRPKGGKFTVKSHMSDKAKKSAKEKLKTAIIDIQKNAGFNDTRINKAVGRLNSLILGLHGYYKVATHVSLDFNNIAFLVRKTLKSRLDDIATQHGLISNTFLKYYKDFKGKIYRVRNTCLYPISHVKTDHPMSMTQDICDYTEKGRALIHAKLVCVDNRVIGYLHRNPVAGESTEFNDNRISLYVGQNGKCAITGEPLSIGSMHVHHKKPKSIGGTDEYSNLILINDQVHKLLHATIEDTIRKYLDWIKPTGKALDKINKLRNLMNLEMVYYYQQVA